MDCREGFDPYRDTVGPGIYGGIVKRDENGEVGRMMAVEIMMVMMEMMMTMVEMVMMMMEMVIGFMFHRYTDRSCCFTIFLFCRHLVWS